MAEQQHETLAIQIERDRLDMVRFAFGMLGHLQAAEDAAGEAGLRLLGHQGEVRDPHAFLFKALTRICVDDLRKRKRRAAEGSGVVWMKDPLELRERDQAVRRALNALDADARAALLLRTHEGLSYRQIADALEATEEQVTNWIYRGKCELRRRLAEYREHA